MFHLQFGIENNPHCLIDQAIAELDILDRRQLEAFLVEAAGGKKVLPPDRAARTPESSRLELRVLMEMMVREILELADDLYIGRVSIVGSDHRAHLRACHGGEHAANSVGCEHHIGVDKKQDLAERSLSPAIARRRYSRMLRQLDEPHRKARGDRDRVIEGMIVYYDQLNSVDRVVSRLRNEGREASRQGCASVAGCNDRADAWRG
jgi:hypothetical protein